jgi:hypothetical protein
VSTPLTHTIGSMKEKIHLKRRGITKSVVADPNNFCPDPHLDIWKFKGSIFTYRHYFRNMFTIIDICFTVFRTIIYTKRFRLGNF